MASSAAILLLDDDTRHLLASILSSKSYRVRSVRTIAEAECCLASEQFLAVVVALEVDEIHLQKLCTRARQVSIPEIIVLTSEQCPKVPTCIDAILPSWPPTALLEAIEELRWFQMNTRTKPPIPQPGTKNANSAKASGIA